ncbi:MAG: STAS domain-containing protein, partial [Methanomassiliicoccales archaeon]|nr:STAS domain-containing protein [Methanomassiliicoccales archaeon]
VIVSSMVALLDIKALKSVYTFDRLEFVFAIAAMLGVLVFGLLQGVFIGVALTLLALLYRISKPSITQLGRIPGTAEYTDMDRSPQNEITPGVLVLRIEGPLIFPNVARVRQEVKRLVKEGVKVELVVLSMRSAPYMDLSATEMLSNLYDELKAVGTSIRLAEALGACRDSITKAGLNERFGELSPGMSVQKVIDDWFEGKRE